MVTAGSGRPSKQANGQVDQTLPNPSRSVRAARAALLSESAIALLAQLQPVLCEITRAQIVRALAAAPLSVSDLSRVIARSKWTTSRHLGVLRSVNVVVGKRHGRRMIYSLVANGPTRSAVQLLDIVASTPAEPAR
jgi:DNA-binding transcriptional ArsR family regulator